MFGSFLSRLNGRDSSWFKFLLVVLLVLKCSVQHCWESESGVRLNFICVEPDPLPTDKNNVPVIMLHGLLDIKETWNGIYQNVSSITHRKVCIYDARNHGDSSWIDTFSIDALAEDLGNFMNMEEIERAVIVGHSMGGLTAMKFTLDNPSKVDGIFVEDIGLKVGDEVASFLKLIMKIIWKSLSVIPDGADGPTAGKAVVNYLKRRIRQRVPETYLENFPLHLSNGTWQWKTNFEAIEKAGEHVDSYSPKLEGQYEGKALFIYGKSSFFGVERQKENITKLFPNAKFVGVEGPSHIIHFDYPGFTKELLDFLE